MSEEKVTNIETTETAKKKGGCLQGCLTILIIFVAFGAIVGACFGDEDEEETTPVTSEETSVADKKEEKEKTLVEKTEIAVIDAINEKNNQKEKRIVSIEGDTGLLKITLNADESLTVNLTKESMWIKTVDVLEAVDSISEINKVAIIWMYPMVDTYGNTESSEVMRIFVDRETLDKINYENFNYQKIPDIAYNYFMHPSFNK